MHKWHGIGPISDIDRINERKLRTALSLARLGDPIITGHKKSDCDMHAAAYVLTKEIERLGGSSRVVIESVLPDAQSFIDRMGMQIETWDHVSDSCVIVIVDTNHLARVHQSIKDRPVTLLIDHHRPSTSPICAQLEISDPDAVATCAILARCLRSENISSDVAFALAVGIASDVVDQPGRLPLALPTIHDLLGICGATESEVFALGHPPHPEYAEILKFEADRATTGRKHGYRFAVGLTQLEPPFLATLLRDKGNSIAMALNPQNGGENLVSIRVDEFARSNRIHANEIARLASEELGVPPEQRGGGHTDMGGALLPGDPSFIQGQLVRIIGKAILDANGQRAEESI